MADTKIVNLVGASPLDGTELYYSLQGGADRKVTGEQIKTFVLTDAPYDLTVFVEGTMANGETILRYVAPRNFSIPAGGAGSGANAATAATGSTTLTLTKNGTSFGTLVFAPSATTATVTISTQTDFALGDVFAITGPSTADATLANIGISLAGFRS